MAVAINGSAQVFGTSTSTSIVIPPSTQVGDLIILQAVGGWTPSVPTGWTQEYAYASTNIGAFVAYKTAGVGDAGATVTVSWSSSYNHVLNLIVVSGGSGVRSPASHLWSSSGNSGTPTAQSAAAGDMAIYLAGNRQDGGFASLSRGTVDIAATDGSNTAAGTIGHELLIVDEIVSCTFTAPSSGSGYQYSVMLVSGGGTPASTVMMSRHSVELLAADTVTTAQVSRASIEVLVQDSTVFGQTSRTSLEILIPTAPRFRGWGVRR